MLSSRPSAAPPMAGSWTVTARGNEIIATFVGHLDPESGERSVRAFVAEMGDRQVAAVFDIREMAGYDAAARREWIRHLSPVRRQIHSITLVGGNVLVRLGGTAMGALLGIPVNARDDL